MKKLKYTLISLSLLALVLTLVSCQNNSSKGRDWSQWKGPFANGTTDEKNWDANLLSDSSRLIWTVDIGKGHSNIAVKGNFLYTFGNNQIIENEDTTYYDLISCLNTNDGSNNWTYRYESEDGRFPGPCSSPVIDGDYLYTFGRNGDLHCLNATSGYVIWKHQLTDLGYRAPTFGFSSSPVVKNNKLILKIGETAIAYNKQNGETIWAGDTNKYSSYSSVVVFKDNNRENLLLSNGDSLIVLDIDSGQKAMSYPWKDIGSDPLVSDSTVLLSNIDDGTVLLDISNDQAQQIWKNDSIKGLFQGFIKSGNYAYGFTRKKNKMPLACISLENGELKWEQDLDKWGSLSIADNKLIILSGKGQLIIAEASSEKFTEISSQQLFEITAEDFKKNTNCCWTMPFISHGKIYARTPKGKLACVDLSM